MKIENMRTYFSNFILWLICTVYLIKTESYEKTDFPKHNVKRINESDTADRNLKHDIADRALPHWHAKVTVIKEFIFFPDNNLTNHAIRTSGNYSLKNKALHEAKLNCGKMNKKIENPYPWMVGIFIKIAYKKYDFQCSGSLITTRHILTAAHCLYKLENSTKNIIRKYRTEEVFVAFPHKSKSLSKKFYPVQQLIPHKKFSKFVDDVGIIKLDEVSQWKMHTYMRPICLPGLTSPWSRFSSGQKLTVAGWIPSDQRFITQAGEVTIIEGITCQKYFLEKISEGHICSHRDDEGACQNSTGGPLMRIRENRWNLDGVVAFNKKCQFYPLVYSNIAKYIPWIRKAIK